jgi:excisionase family DNA binding protein
VIRAEVEAALAHGTGPQAVLTTKEAAKPAGVTPRTIQKWVREGRLQPLGGRPYRFRLADVERARDRQVIDDSVLNLEERANELLARRKRGEKL